MIVKLTNGRVSIEDANNFRAFKLVVEGERDSARKTLAGLAEFIDDTHAWISEAALRQFPEVAQDQNWQSGLGVMIEKARPHGWVDDQKKAIKAHIEWQK